MSNASAGPLRLKEYDVSPIRENPEKMKGALAMAPHPIHFIASTGFAANQPQLQLSPEDCPWVIRSASAEAAWD